MFEQNRPYRIRFQLPEGSRGKIDRIRNIEFNADGIYIFEGMLPEYEAVKKFLRGYGVEPMDVPDLATKVERPAPQGIGKIKLANVQGTRDDLDDLSEFKGSTTDGTPSRPASEGNRQPPASQRSGSEGAAGVRHGSGAGPASGPTSGSVPTGQDGVGAEAEVSAEGFQF